jgi:hypothetical protein
MGVKEDFISWQSSNPGASREEQKNKILELKRVEASAYTPEMNVQRAIESAESEGDVSSVDLLRAMQKGKLGEEALRQGVRSLPYEERYETPYGRPLGETEAKLQEALFPRTMQAMSTGREFPAVSGIADVASLPGRAVESIGKGIEKDQNVLERMGQADTGTFLAETIRDPYNVLGAGAAASTVSKGLPLAKRAMQYAKSGALSQIPASLMGQAEKIEQGKEFQPGEVVGEVAAGGFIPIAGRLAKKAATPLKEFSKDIMSEATGRSKELLNTIGGEELKEWARKSIKGQDAKPSEVLEKLRNFSDNAEQIAGDILTKVDNFDVIYAEKNEAVKRAVSAMDDMDVAPLLNKLRLSKFDIPSNPAGFKDEISLNNQIDGLINRIEQTTKQYNPELNVRGIVETPLGKPTYNPMTGSIQEQLIKSRGTTIPASEMLQIRRDVDKTINWNKDSFSNNAYNMINKFKRNVRGEIKDDLVSNAEKLGNKQYAKDMKEYARVLGLQDKVKNQILPRVNDLGEVDRVTNFLLKSSSPNKLDQKIFMKNIEPILGVDLMEKGNFLRLSKEYRDALPIANDIATGRKNWLQGFMSTTGGKLATAPLSSPKMAAPITKALDVAGEGLAEYGPSLSRIQQKITPVATEEAIGE